MVSSPHYRTYQNSTHQNSTSQRVNYKTALVGVDRLAQLPGSIVLPPLRSEDFVSQRHEVNPAIALNLLQDIQSAIVSWQEQLRQLVAALHRLQAQGPMVDGWLESSADSSQCTPDADATLLRHGDTDALMQYVETLDEALDIPSAHSSRHQPDITSGYRHTDSTAAASPSAGSYTHYRLCSLDENSQLRSQPCPPEQMGMVSMAIARYQKYKQLLAQKRVIDAKLQAAVDQLTGVRAMVQQAQQQVQL